MLAQPWWSAQGCVPATCSITLGVSAEPGSETPQQHVSGRKPDPPEGRVEPARVAQTAINIGMLITKTFLFPLMNNTFKMHASLVLSIWKSLLCVSLLVLTALILAWGGMPPCIPHCTAVCGRGFVGKLRRTVLTACELSRDSLEAAPSLPWCGMALRHG